MDEVVRIAPLAGEPAEVYQRQDRGVSTVRRYRLHRDIKSVAERLPRRDRLSGYVQELSCLSTTHKEKWRCPTLFVCIVC
jgi:hypothetical protein